MDLFDYSMLSGLPPIGFDLNPGAVLAALPLAILLASTVGILCSRRVGLPRRGFFRWISRTQGAASGERHASRTARRANEPITVGRAIRLTTESRK